MHGHGQVRPEECAYTAAGTLEVKRWIYAWLPYAEVLEPAWFRKQVEKELGAALNHHARSLRPSTKN